MVIQQNIEGGENMEPLLINVNIPDEDFLEEDFIENDDDFEDEDDESVDDRYDDAVVGDRNGLTIIQTEICLMNQAIEVSGLQLSAILPAIAWLSTHSGQLVPCLECLSNGWQENEQGQTEGTGRCSKHVNHDNEDYLPELEQEVFPNYLEILGEA